MNWKNEKENYYKYQELIQIFIKVGVTIED